MVELIGSRGLQRIDFLKVDIEGAEFDLFDTASGWLKIVRKIAVEVHCRFGDVRELRRILMNAGFRVVLMRNRGNVVRTFSDKARYLFVSSA
jgi:Methyltransferase FkbM domain